MTLRNVLPSICIAFLVTISHAHAQKLDEKVKCEGYAQATYRDYMDHQRQHLRADAIDLQGKYTAKYSFRSNKCYMLIEVDITYFNDDTMWVSKRKVVLNAVDLTIYGEYQGFIGYRKTDGSDDPDIKDATVECWVGDEKSASDDCGRDENSNQVFDRRIEDYFRSDEPQS